MRQVTVKVQPRRSGNFTRSPTCGLLERVDDDSFGEQRRRPGWRCHPSGSELVIIAATGIYGKYEYGPPRKLHIPAPCNGVWDFIMVVDQASAITRLTTRWGFIFAIRPANGDDEPLLGQFFDAVSPEDLRFRFLSSVRHVGHDQLRNAKGGRGRACPPHPV
jgi:hypothetical protein